MVSVADLTHPNLPVHNKLIICKKMKRTRRLCAALSKRGFFVGPCPVHRYPKVRLSCCRGDKSPRLRTQIDAEGHLDLIRLAAHAPQFLDDTSCCGQNPV